MEKEAVKVKRNKGLEVNVKTEKNARRKKKGRKEWRKRLQSGRKGKKVRYNEDDE